MSKESGRHRNDDTKSMVALAGGRSKDVLGAPAGVDSSREHEVLFSFIILTWNSSHYIGRCIDSYAHGIRSEGLSAEFLVVDNGSRDDTVREIERNVLPHLSGRTYGRVIQLGKNYGTTVSRNIALRMARGQILVICDSDTEYEAGSWADAANYLQENRDAGIIAPRLNLPDGTVQESVKRFPTVFDKTARLRTVFLKKKVVTSDRYEDFPWDAIRPADTAISACWLLRRDTLNVVGYLDERIFYSPEDLDFCMRVWKRKKEVLFYPELEVLHHTQQVSHKKPFSRHAIGHMAGLVYYFIKHRYFLSRRRFRMFSKDAASF